MQNITTNTGDAIVTDSAFKEERGISANVLFHFTRRIDNLLGILKNEFHPRFCLESTEHTLSDPSEVNKNALPMVCFCDLPISHIAEHVEFYGRYGLGMSKEWGMKYGVSPMVYSYPGSHVSQSLVSLQEAVSELSDGMKNRYGYSPIHVLAELLSFLKPIEGPTERDGKYYDRKVFYNEREWRYVPSISEHDPHEKGLIDMILTEEEFMDEERLKKANADMAEQYTLPFEPDDIRYIILDNESEILPFIEELRHIKRKKEFPSVEVLVTRITTAERLLEDI